MSIFAGNNFQHEIDFPNLSVFQCIYLLRRHINNIGIHHALVKKLYSFPYDELEFFIPQFIQLLVSFETDSMALEDFLLVYCSRYPHFSLIVFWYLQAFVSELRNQPESYSFQTVRKFINKLQNILFNVEEYSKPTEFRENLYPALVLCGTVASSFGLPALNGYAAPLIRSQGNQQKSFVFKLANYQKALTRNLTMKNQRLSSDSASRSSTENTKLPPKSPLGEHAATEPQSKTISKKNSMSFSSDDSETYTTDDEDNKLIELSRVKDSNVKLETYRDIESKIKINATIRPKKSKLRPSMEIIKRESDFLPSTDPYNLNSKSLPDLSKLKSKINLHPTESEASLSLPGDFVEISRSLSHSQKLIGSPQTYGRLHRTLQVNYARAETDLIMSLQNISMKLSQVPKEARLSALRAELSIINESLVSSNIDIPQLLPITSNKNKKFHKILKLSINEACVLNSAERVPYLLLIEYLSDELDFNPFTEYNQKIISSQFEKQSSTSNRSASEYMDLSLSADDSTVLEASAESLGASATLSASEADLGELPMINSRNVTKAWTKMEQTRFSNVRTGYNDSSARGSSPVTVPVDSSILVDQMRIASVMLQQLESSGQSNSAQFIAIKNRIVESMISLQDQFDSIDYEKLKELKSDQQDAGQRKWENDFKLSEDWSEKKKRIRKSSAYGHLPNWDLCSIIVKNGDDLPQEAFACQLITLISNIWKKQGVGAWTKRMKILITSANAGLVETIINSMSIHSIKKSLTEISISKGENTNGRIFTLKDYFLKLYGNPDSRSYVQAQDNFARSLASYSIICYVLQIKDRHNGNIMLDHEGHIIHIDFGFLLSNSPGSVGFEAAPFKLTSEYIDVLGGLESKAYKTFVDTCKNCFISLRKESDQIVNMVELMQKDSSLPCFKNGENTSVLLEQRFQLQLKDEEVGSFVENILIGKSIGSMYTRLYDQFQMITQGIYS